MTSHSFPSRFVRDLAAWRRWLLLGLLGLLHLVLMQSPDNLLGRTLFVGHLGLFILWQPFVRAERHISPAALLFVVGTVAVSAVWLDWILVALWLMLLAGIVSGKVFLFEARWSKTFYLLALAYLVAALLLVAMPQAAPGVRSPEVVAAVGRWVLPLLLLAMAVLPERREADGEPEVVDFVYSVFVFLLLAVLVLGSLALMLVAGRDYFTALLATLLAIGAVLLILGWVWNPHAGLAGMGAVFSRYLMSIGLPMERWLHTLADLAQRQEDPDLFVAEACAEMGRRLPWVTGGTWATATAAGEFGLLAGRRSEFRFGDVRLAIHTRYPLSPSLRWHFNLLAQLVAEFHADRRRARQLKQMSYVQAIHETGARLTHDIKNLLQSLHALCAVADDHGGDMPADFVPLLRRQLPAIAQRLGLALDKLRAPRWEPGGQVAAAAWWADWQRRYAGAGVVFSTAGDLAAALLPDTLFANVAENLLENALDKRRAAPGLGIAATLRAGAAGIELEVCDDGAAIPAPLAAELTRGPVASENGLGIGLFQAARLAELSSYCLALVANEPGRVCFRLAAVPGAVVK